MVRDYKSISIVWLIMLIVLVNSYAITPDSKDWATDQDCKFKFEKCDMNLQKWNHKNFFPLHFIEFFGVILLGVCIAFWNASGIGGGGIIVTIWVVFLSFSAKESVALSNFSIFWGGVARYIKNFNNRHPLKNAPAIDYEIVAWMLPVTMLGTFAGVELNRSFPRIIVFSMLCLTLTILSLLSVWKGIRTFKEETLHLENEKQTSPPIYTINEVAEVAEFEEEKDVKLANSHHNLSNNVYNPLIDTNSSDMVNTSKSVRRQMSVPRQDSNESNAVGPPITKNNLEIDIFDRRALLGRHQSSYRDTEVNPELEKILLAERNHWRPRNLFVVACPFFTVLIISFLRGSPKFNSIIGVERCDALDFVLLFLNMATLLVLEAINIRNLKRDYGIKENNNYQFVKGDVAWNSQNIEKFILLGLVGGVVSGLVGLGGGAIYTPLLMEFGIAPSIAGGTSMYMSVFATLSASILFMFQGFLIYEWALTLSISSVIGTVFGITIIGNLVKSSGRSSYLILLLAFVLSVSAFVIGTKGALNILDDIEEGNKLFDFIKYW